MVLNKTKSYNIPSVIMLIGKCSPVYVSLYFLFNLLGALLSTVLIYVTTGFLNSALTLATGHPQVQTFVASIILIFLFYIYFRISGIFLGYIHAQIGCRIRSKVVTELVEKQSRLEYEFIEDCETLNLINRVMGNAEGKITSILDNSMSAISTTIRIAGILSVLLIQNWWLSLIFLVMAIPLILIAIWGGKNIYEMERKVSHLTRYMEYLSEILSNRESAAERTLFGYTDTINNEYKEVQRKRTNMNTTVLARWQIRIQSYSLILYIFLILVIIVLTKNIQNQTMSVGLYVSLLGALLNMIRSIVDTVSGIFMNFSANKEFCHDFSIFLQLSEIHISQGSPVDAFQFESLKLVNVSFKYRNSNEYTLENINLWLEKGKSYSLVGKNGSGKTTLVKLITGVYNHYEGQIYLNRKNIKDYNSDQLSSIFAVAYQDFAKYGISLKDNITIGDEADESFARTIEKTNIQNIIDKLHNGPDTILGKLVEDGVDLSSGEWQRIALARAIHRNCPFIILDEPTASLSPIAENELYSKFAEIVKDRTSLLISHRLGSTKITDTIVVLDDGKIIEQGTHQKLIENNGLYKEMYTSQWGWYHDDEQK